MKLLYLRMFVLFGLIAALAYSVYEITQEFLYSNVTVNMRVTTKREMEFPGVTLCNLNAFMCDKVHENEDMVQLMHGACPKDPFLQTNSTDEPKHPPREPRMKRQSEVLGPREEPIIHLTGDPTTLKEITKQQQDGYMMEQAPGSYSDLYRRRMSFLKTVHSLNDSTRMAAGHSFRELIIQCTFETEECIETDFLHTLSKDYGNCYTFNSAYASQDGKIVYNPENIKRVLGTGPINGLEIVFNTMEYQYVPGIAHEAGLRIVLHDPHILPHDIFSQGRNVSPGKFTAFGVQTRQYKHLNDTKNQCSESYSAEVMEEYPNSFKESETYVQQKCSELALQTVIRKTQNCRDADIIGYEDHPELIECHLKFPNGDYCKDALEIFMNMSNHCFRECTKLEYFVTTSGTRWPARSFKNSLQLLYNLSHVPQEIFEDNFGKFTIYYEALHVEEINETQRFTVLSLISNYGGYAGLYIGASFMTIVYLIEVGIERCKNRNSKTENLESVKTETSDGKTVPENYNASAGRIQLGQPTYMHLYAPDAPYFQPVVMFNTRK